MSSNTTCQLIDDAKNFNQDDFEKLLVKFSLPTESSLRVISILGPQSSGKSTLLNSLFSSEFQVMDQSTRRQTTKGIWLTIIADHFKTGSATSAIIPTIILDVEGTDGRERGDDQDFERKSALFSLAVSDILLINIWESSVGLYHGANMSLLRTVMDVHLKLNSKSQTRKTIFFVIRDFIGNTPKENITSVLSKDIENLWTSLAPPNSLFESFDLQFAFLPHFHLQKEAFSLAIEELKPILLDFSPSHPDSVTLSKDWGMFSSQLWRTIQDQKELDLPSEREMLSRFRCEQIMEGIYSEVLEKLPNKEIISQSILRFQEEGQSYSPSVLKEKVNELEDRLWKHSYLLLRTSIQDQQSALFSVPFKISTSLPIISFLENIKVYETDLTESFNEFISESSKEFINPSFEIEKTNFSKALKEKIENYKYENCVVNFSTLKGEISSILSVAKKCSFAIKDCSAFWSAFDSLIKDSENLLKVFLGTIDLSPQNEERFTKDCRTFLEEEITSLKKASLLDSHLFLERLQKKFDFTFLKDENGHLRVWNDVDTKKMEDQFTASMGECVDFADVLCKIPYESISLTLSDRECQLDTLREWADKRLISVKKDCLSKAKTELPLWVFAVMIILGWNHIVYLLKRPLLLILAIFLLIGALIFRKLRLHTFIMMYLRSLNINGIVDNFSNANSNDSSKIQTKNKSD